MKYSTLRPRQLASLALAVLTITVAACGSDTASGPPAAPATPDGLYMLASVSGKAVPITMFSDTAFTIILSSGSLALRTDGTLVTTVTTNETVAGNLSVYVDSAAGTWTPSGTGSVALTIGSGVASLAAWSGNTITFVDTDSVRWVFKR